VNETKPVNVFEKYENWDKLIQDCQWIEDLTPTEREKARHALEFLREEFGENFLYEASRYYHQLFYTYLINQFAWTYKWIIRFADSLQAMKDKENYSSLVKRLVDAKKFSEGLSVLEVAARLTAVGFEIIFDEKVDVSGKKKKPDLKIIDSETKEDLFVEVTILGPSIQQQRMYSTFNAINNLLMGSMEHVYHRGRVCKDLSPEHLNEVLGKIEKTTEIVKREKSFQVLIEDGVIEIAFAPYNDVEKVSKWAAERDITGNLCGLPVDSNEISRIRTRICEKQGQLPREIPSLIIIKNSNFLFDQKEILKMIGEIGEEVYWYPQIVAVGIVWGYLRVQDEEEIIIKNGLHRYIKKCKDFEVEQSIALFNQYFKLKLSSTTMEKIQSFFEGKII
jgi:hypothetical protein